MKKITDMTAEYVISETTEEGIVTMALMHTLSASPEEAWEALDNTAQRRDTFIYRYERIKAMETEIIL